MAQEDYIEGWRPDKNYRQDRGGVGGYSGPFEAEVMSTVDPTHSGRIQVWIEAFGDESTKEKPETWTTARYLSPYYGVTPHEKILPSGTEPRYEQGNGQAYGMWANVPDPGVRVLVVFSNGQRDKCYYIGFIPEPQMNQMVPAIGAKTTDNVYYPSTNSAQREKCEHASRLPVIEQDKTEKNMNEPNFGSNAIQKPIHSFTAAQMWKQGTVADNVRGPISSSAQRESPSYVYGISTPGRPIYADPDDNTSDTVGRQGGHTFVMDDGNAAGEDRLIRIRTSQGHQITLSDDGKAIYIIHANGLTWWELGNEGTIDMYAANSINMRTGGEINMHADKNININAVENVNVYGKKNVALEAKEALTLSAKQSLTAYSQNVGIKSGGALAMEASSNASLGAGGAIAIKGATIGLNDGGAATVTAPPLIPKVSHPDTVKDAIKGWKVVDGKIESIVTRAPTHEPWGTESGMHNTGVTNVKPPE